MKFNQILLLLALATSSIAIGSEQKKNNEQPEKKRSVEELSKELVDAAFNNDITIVNQALTQGAKPNWRDSNGYTALDTALIYDHYKIVDRLLSIPEARNNIDIDNELAEAMNSREWDLAGVLLYHGASELVKNKRGSTLYEIAQRCKPAKRAYIRFLLRDKVLLPKEVLQLIVRYYSTPFFKVQENLLIDLESNALFDIKKRFSSSKEGLEYLLDNGCTVLLQAIAYQQKDIVAWLLSQGASLDARTDIDTIRVRYEQKLNESSLQLWEKIKLESDYSTIQLAEKLGHTEIVTLLKKEKERREAARKQSCTIEEISNQEIKAEKETKTAKEDTAQKDLNQVAAEKDRLMQELDGYIRANHYKNALSFIEDHNLIHVQDSHGWSPLKLALQYNAKDIGKELIRRRAIVTYAACPSPELQAVYTEWQREVQEEDQQKDK